MFISQDYIIIFKDYCQAFSHSPGMFFLTSYLGYALIRKKVVKVMSTISGRISAIIERKGLTKTAFAKKIGLSQPFVSNLCTGEKVPSDRTISDICREFDVSETWLRTGEGEMFVPLNRSQDIAEFVGKIMVGEEDNFKRRFVAMLARLDESEWELIERKALELFDDAKKD